MNIFIAIVKDTRTILRYILRISGNVINS